jgi:hypothetical protein
MLSCIPEPRAKVTKASTCAKSVNSPLQDASVAPCRSDQDTTLRALLAPPDVSD